MANPIPFPHPTNPARYPLPLRFEGVDVRGGRSRRWPAAGRVAGGYLAPATRPDGSTFNRGGIDIACPEGTPVHAPARGKVEIFDTPGRLGRWVRLDHEGTPYYSAYAQLGRAVADLEGKVVEAGTVIGFAGTAPVHWAVAGPNNGVLAFDHAQLYDPLAFTDDPPVPVWPPLDWPRFARNVLAGCGASYTAWGDAVLHRWSEHEGSFRHGVPLSLYNPMNTTQGGPSFPPAPPPPSFVDGRFEWFNSFGPGGNAHVRNYPSQADGETATIETLTNGFYPDVVASLKAGRFTDRAKVAQQIGVWGTHTFADEVRDGWEPRISTEQSEAQAAEHRQAIARAQRADLIRIAGDLEHYRDWVVPLHRLAVELGAAEPRE